MFRHLLNKYFVLAFLEEDDSNAFSKTGAITIKSSSSSSGGLIAALGLSRDGSIDSDDQNETNESKQTSKSYNNETENNAKQTKESICTKEWTGDDASVNISGDVSPDDIKHNIENWIEDSHSPVHKDEKEICDEDSGYDRNSQVDKTSDIEWDGNMMHHLQDRDRNNGVYNQNSSAITDELDLECARVISEAQRGTAVPVRDDQLLMGYYLTPQPPDTPAGARRPVLAEQPSSI